jgi:sterol 3beta-glucosyltransferase
MHISISISSSDSERRVLIQDPYFPHGMIDLRYAISCEPHSEKNIKLRTNQRNITLAADSTTSRDTWVKTIQKVIFKAQNSGESVKVSLPLFTERGELS